MAQVGEVSVGKKARRIPGDLKGLWVESGVSEEGAEKTFSIGKKREQAGATLQQVPVGNNN